MEKHCVYISRITVRTILPAVYIIIHGNSKLLFCRILILKYTNQWFPHITIVSLMLSVMSMQGQVTVQGEPLKKYKIQRQWKIWGRVIEEKSNKDMDTEVLGTCSSYQLWLLCTDHGILSGESERVLCDIKQRSR